MSLKDRRRFLQSMGLTAAVATTGSCQMQTRTGQIASKKAVRKFKLGLASYSLRKFKLEEALAMTKRVGLEYIALKSFHLPLESTLEEIIKATETIKKTGIELYGGGVIYMKDEKAVHQAFEYARAAGMKMIVGVPVPDVLGIVEGKVKEYDIMVAIHNHGPTDKIYPTPGSAYKKIKHLDRRIGLCNDIGHTQRAGVDPSESVLKYADRLIDVHIKDVSKAAKEGRTVEIGRGVIDIPKFIRTLTKINYTGIVSFEYEKDAADPLAGLAESVGYVKGVIAAI
ncbi:MAG: sugar phosphate isomerase/epimerase [Sedimentisphaerales bacterium]|nr:sugar phosphate isomerase/epimerase [Sedimentisphaerales bacterium]